MAEFPIDVVIRSSKAVRGGRQAERAIRGVDQAAERTQKSVQVLNRALGTLAAAFSVRQVVRYVDSFTNLQNRLRLVTTSTGNLRRVTQELLSIANQTRGSFESTTELYAKFALGTRELGLSQERLLGIIQSVNRAVTLSGADTAAAAGGLRQLAQGIQSGTLRGEELVSVLENLPRVARVIADGMGVAVGSLRELGATGRITGADVIAAFEAAEDQLAKEFGTAVITVGQSFQILQNNIIATLGSLNEGSGASEIFANSVVLLANNVDTLVRGLVAAGIALSVSFAAKGVMVAVAAVRALNVAILANPIGAITTGLVIATSTLIAFSDQINIGGNNLASLADFGKAAFEVIGASLSTLTSTFSSTFPAISSLVRDALGDIDLTVVGVATSVARLIDGMIGLFKGLADAIPIAMSNLPRTLELVFKRAFNVILRASADFTNVIVRNMNLVARRIGLPLIAEVEALQIPMSEAGEDIGKALGAAITKGVQGQDGAQQALKQIIDRANELARSRALEDVDNDLVNLGESGNIAAQALEKTGKGLKEVEKGAGDATGPLEAYRRAQERAADITNDVATAQERYERELRELDSLLSTQLIGPEVYNRRLQELKRTLDDSNNIFGNFEQFGIQAARNVQTAFADFLFDPFDKGLKGMLSSFANILKRMVAEIAASGILKGLGSLASGGSFSSGFSGILGSLGSAGSGAQGAGIFGGALGGASVGSILGPVAITGLAVGIGSQIAGDKKIFGASGTVTSAIGAALGGPVGAVLGGALNSVFGRGPLKQRDSLFRGTITSEGTGDDFLTSTRFKASGGLLRGDKVDRVIINANTGELLTRGAPGLPESGISSGLLPFADDASNRAQALNQVFNTAIDTFNTSLRASAEDLNVSTKSLDNFRTFIQLTTDSADGFTEEEIAAQIADIGEQMTRSLLPAIDRFSQGGETAFQTFQRLGAELNAIEAAARALGLSLNDATRVAGNLGVEARSNIIESFGGIDAFSEKITFFTDNFLTEERRLEIATESVNDSLQRFNITVQDTTAEAFGNLIESFLRMGEAGAETASELLGIAPSFLQVRNSLEQASQSLDGFNAAVGSVVGNVGLLVNAVQFMGFSLAQAQQIITELGEDTQNSIISTLGGATTFQQNFKFFTDNFLTDAERVRVSGDRLNEQLAKFGLTAQTTSRRDFADLVLGLLQVGDAGRIAANELLTLAPELFAFQTALDNLQPSQTIVSATDNVTDAENRLTAARDRAAGAASRQNSLEQQLAQAEQAQAQRAAQAEEAAARRQEEQERSRLIQTLRRQSQELSGFVNRFDGLTDSLRQASDSLSLGQLSPLTPVQRLDEARRQLLQTRNAAFSGDADALSELPNAIDQFLNASRVVNASGNGFTSDFNFAKSILDQAENIAIQERDIAEDQLNSINASVEELERIQEEARRIDNSVNTVDNSIINLRQQVQQSMFEVEQATNEVAVEVSRVEAAVIALGNAILQGQGNPGISDQQIRDFVAANPHLNAQQIGQVAIDNGVSARQFARATGTPIDAVNRAIGGRSVSDAEIANFVNQNLNNPLAIYNAAVGNGISSQRLAAASQLTIDQIRQFVQDNNLAAFESGTDRVPRTGIALIHKNESIGPSTMPGLLEEMRQELVRMREQNEVQSQQIIQATQQASERVVEGNFEVNDASNFAKRTANTRR